MATASPPAVFNRALAMPPASNSARPRASAGGDHVERLDHAQHGAHQPQQRADGGHAVEDAEVAAQTVGGPLAGVDHALLDLDARPAPFAHGAGKHLGDGAAVVFAQLQGLFAVELPLAQLLQEPRDKRLGDHAAPPQADRPLQEKRHQQEEQSRMAYIKGPASWMIFLRSVVGNVGPRLRGSGIGRLDRLHRNGGRTGLVIRGAGCGH